MHCVWCICVQLLEKKTPLVDGGFDGAIKLIDLVTDFVVECPLVVAFYCNCPQFWLKVDGTSFGSPVSSQCALYKNIRIVSLCDTKCSTIKTTESIFVYSHNKGDTVHCRKSFWFSESMIYE